MNRSVLSRRARRGGRAVAMVEFAFLLPIFLFFLLFIIDVGNMVMQQAALQDATQQAAREGAQLGLAGESPTAYGGRAFYEAVDAIPGMDPSQVASFRVLSGRCSATSPYIEVDAKYRVKLLTPGLNQLLQVATGQGGSIGSGWQMGATSVARCEVVRE